MSIICCVELTSLILCKTYVIHNAWDIVIDKKKKPVDTQVLYAVKGKANLTRESISLHFILQIRFQSWWHLQQWNWCLVKKQTTYAQTHCTEWPHENNGCAVHKIINILKITCINKKIHFPPY